MDIDQFYQACLGMEVGEERQFELDQVSDVGTLAAITMALALGKKEQGTAVSLLQSGATIHAKCFDVMQIGLG